MFRSIRIMTNAYVCTVESHQFKLRWLLIEFLNNNRQTMHVKNVYSKNIFIGKENLKKNWLFKWILAINISANEISYSMIKFQLMFSLECIFLRCLNMDFSFQIKYILNFLFNPLSALYKLLLKFQTFCKSIAEREREIIVFR